MSEAVPEESKRNASSMVILGLVCIFKTNYSNPLLFPVLPFLKNKLEQAKLHSQCKYLLMRNHAVFPVFLTRKVTGIVPSLEWSPEGTERIVVIHDPASFYKLLESF